MCLFIAGATDAAAAAQAESAEFFESRVAPILATRCIECHGEGGKGGLNLRTRDTAMAGGKEGGDIIPGKPEESRLYQYVSTQEMPPKHPLSAEEIEVLRQWIADGAYFPDAPIDPFAYSSEKRAGYDWWSLQPLAPGNANLTIGDAAPGANQEIGVPGANPIDDFVMATLDEKELASSPPATPRDLLRRATHDLTGLPPTPTELDTFLAGCLAETGMPDTVGDQTYRALLMRLLASPHYGERWGRHWLDVIRYGESNGYERNVLFDNIWPFRDYVIRSFNEDKPFSRMVLEQLAGDSLEPGNPEVEVALTYLVCGPFDDVGNSDPVQAAQTRANNLDEMIRTTSEAFLGLTIGCARCHDHKFDPIAQKDYYRLYATFDGVNHGDREVATEAQRQERSAKLAPLFAAKAEATKQRERNKSRPILARGEAHAADYEAQWTRPPVSRNLTEEIFAPTQARYVRFTSEGRDSDPNDATGFRIDEFEVFTPDNRNVALASNGGKATGESKIAEDFTQAYDPSLVIDGQYAARWFAYGPELTLEFAQAETITRVAFSSDRPGAVDVHSPEIPFPCEYRLEASIDGETWVPIATSRDRLPADEAHRRKRLMDFEITPEERAQLASLEQKIAEVDQQIAAIPALPVLRVGKMEEPRDPTHLFLGGDPQRTADEVPPSSPRVLAKAAGEYTQDAKTPEAERRLALARWIIHKDNPLPPRVLANRIWQHHFGTGLVSTPSDFGFMGTPAIPPGIAGLAGAGTRAAGRGAKTAQPLSPPERIRQAWRLKRMHKLIMLSRTYRQSSAYNETAAALDGDSRLLWRYPPRRLSAEEIRDGVLAIAGKLDTTWAGPASGYTLI